MSMLLFILHELWSIIADSGSVVSSVVSSHPTLLSFHMLARNSDRAHSGVFQCAPVPVWRLPRWLISPLTASWERAYALHLTTGSRPQEKIFAVSYARYTFYRASQ